MTTSTHNRHAEGIKRAMDQHLKLVIDSKANFIPSSQEYFLAASKDPSIQVILADFERQRHLFEARHPKKLEEIRLYEILSDEEDFVDGSPSWPSPKINYIRKAIAEDLEMDQAMPWYLWDELVSYLDHYEVFHERGTHFPQDQFKSMLLTLHQYLVSRLDSQDLDPAKVRSRSLLPLPHRTKWEEVTIKFINPQDISVDRGKERIGIFSYNALGDFEDKRAKRPNKQWELLRKLAELHGEGTTHELATTAEGKNNLSKCKGALSKALQAAFGIQDDPFMDYRREKLHKVRFNLIPETPDYGDDTTYISADRRLEGMEEQFLG